MTIRPFAAVRPSVSDAAFVASVPYDVVTLDEARKLAKGNPKSFLHVSRSEIDLPDGTKPSSPAALAQAKKAFDAMLASGALSQDGAPRYYAYRQTTSGRSQTGLVLAFDAKDYDAGIVKKHELTRKDKEDERTLHIETLGAQTGPAFLAYRDNAEITAVVAKACEGGKLFDWTAEDGIRHEGWVVAEGGSDTASRLETLFAPETAYIADGHHRTAAAARYARERNFEGESRYIMAVAFPAGELGIMPYNRLVKGLNGLSPYEFLSAVSQSFDIDGDDKNARGCRMYFKGAWHELSWNVPRGASAIESLDASYLQTHLLSKILDIADPRTDKRISFSGGIHGEAALERQVDSGEADVAFSMKAVTMEEIMSIADGGGIMPPKSTWFEPKLRSGLFIHLVGAQA